MLYDDDTGNHNYMNTNHLESLLSSSSSPPPAYFYRGPQTQVREKSSWIVIEGGDESECVDNTSFEANSTSASETSLRVTTMKAFKAHLLKQKKLIGVLKSNNAHLEAKLEEANGEILNVEEAAEERVEHVHATTERETSAFKHAQELQMEQQRVAFTEVLESGARRHT
eukprot:m.9410 g.9410  ORF g.9410 m.9410 type:complete len:169 (-) comp6343_c0_seq2:800-1306(-)